MIFYHKNRTQNQAVMIFLAGITVLGLTFFKK
jgi:hypothetical protein